MPMFAALNDLTDLTLVDLPTGHWPMLSRPDDLADLIAALADHESSPPRHRQPRNRTRPGTTSQPAARGTNR
jgi:hypothetical protein